MNTTTDYKVWNKNTTQGSPKAQPIIIEKTKNENWKDIIQRLNKKYGS